MTRPRFVATECGWQSDHEAMVVDTIARPFNGIRAAPFEAVCLCCDMETAELVARALNREMMQ